MFIIEMIVIDGEVRLPHIWPRHLVLVVELMLVPKVGILDMLNQPVLGPMNHLNGYWDHKSTKLLEEPVMLPFVGVTFVIMLRRAENTTLIVKVRPHLGLEGEQICCTGRIVFKRPKVIEQSFVFEVESLVPNFDTVVPVVGGRNVPGQLVYVLEVCVLDVLNKPILGPGYIQTQSFVRSPSGA
jgi:hypothetical protein